MHTNHMLVIFKELTMTLGDQLQFFASETCSNFETFELPREAAARQCQQSKKPQVDILDADPNPGKTRCQKTINIDTYKHHALGDYVETIQTYGTSDSYSMELVYNFFL
jgi:hypothetical protein